MNPNKVVKETEVGRRPDKGKVAAMMSGNLTKELKLHVNT
jgi:hypothetical protein